MVELREAEARGRDVERRRCVGLVLREVGLARLRHEDAIADRLDALATALEHEPTSAIATTDDDGA